MNLANNAILITGGGSGIGLALAERFLSAGSKVIVCGRRHDVLKEAVGKHPGLIAKICDVQHEHDRVELFDDVTQEHPDLNMLINNAGIQNRPLPITHAQVWGEHAKEISINLEAPMHLSLLFAPFLIKQKNAAIINITSGLAFVPIASMPTYCATKAALHSFTMSLRRQLRETPVKVYEVAPPGVQTDLGGKGLHDWGVPLNEFADFAMSKLAAGEEEFGYQFSEKGMTATHEERTQMFEGMNRGQQ